MPPPMQLTRHADFGPAEYAQPYPSYSRTTDRVYARPYPPPDYMTYEERRAFEEHHARARLEANNLYDPRGSSEYVRTPSPDPMSVYPGEMANRLGRPTVQVPEHHAARRQAEPSNHPTMERLYAPRRSPIPDVLYPPSARVADRPAYESDVYAAAPLASIRRPSDPYFRMPSLADGARRDSVSRGGRVAPHRVDDGRTPTVLPPMSTSPHAVRHEALSGLPMLPARDDPLSRPYASSYGYAAHPDSAKASESARRDSREDEVEHRRNLFRAPPVSRPPPGPSRP